ncbi:MAG: L-serine ammonia-lyase, iron-sulfur-dependent, subunit alpha [Epulopiscium sp.]|nr:L-serine ammonia-lyase, iron-sulfur-dependent, subunit alpha [Candidatus Epulonipiscium sp.]
MEFKTGAELLEICNIKNCKIYDAAIFQESKLYGISKEEIYIQMKAQLSVMRHSVEEGLSEERKMVGKIIGGEGKKIRDREKNIKPVCGHTMAKAMSYAFATMETNAGMGKIVAAPTAGSCGVLPAILLSIEDSHQVEEQVLLQGLITAGAVGLIIAKNATLSGAEGGCQAEVGSAAAMGAAAIVEMMGGTPAQALHGAAIALKNLMGLICDPIAGLVEAPCSKRNAIGTANALISAEMALSGIESVIPFDEVVATMYQVGRMLPCALRETAEGGIAITPTGLKIKEEIFQ